MLDFNFLVAPRQWRRKTIEPEIDEGKGDKKEGEWTQFKIIYIH